METDRLIRAIAADPAKPSFAVERVFSVATGVAVAIAVTVFWKMLGPRPDIVTAAQTLPFLFKFLVTLSLFGTAFATLTAIMRPEATLRSELPLLLLTPILLGVGIALETIGMSTEEMRTRWMGTNLVLCLTFIPLIGLGPLLVFLLALRHAAPARPTLAGAVAGLSAGGLAATLYAAHCIDDSSLFVASWYTIAIAGLALVGGLAGRFGLRW